MKILAAASIAAAATLVVVIAPKPAAAGCHLIDCVENVRITASQVRNHSCEDLWILRNSIYKDAGYCFKTARAINWFGNAGCRYDSMSAVPLSSIQRHNVGVLAAAERRRGC